MILLLLCLLLLMCYSGNVHKMPLIVICTTGLLVYFNTSSCWYIYIIIIRLISCYRAIYIFITLVTGITRNTITSTTV